MLQCLHCAATVSQNAAYCENCGNPIDTDPPLYGTTTEKLAKSLGSPVIASLILDDDHVTLTFQDTIQEVLDHLKKCVRD